MSNYGALARRYFFRVFIGATGENTQQSAITDYWWGEAQPSHFNGTGARCIGKGDGKKEARRFCGQGEIASVILVESEHYLGSALNEPLPTEYFLGQGLLRMVNASQAGPMMSILNTLSRKPRLQPEQKKLFQKGCFPRQWPGEERRRTRRSAGRQPPDWLRKPARKMHQFDVVSVPCWGLSCRLRW